MSINRMPTDKSKSITGQKKYPPTMDSIDLYNGCLRGDEDAWEIVYNFVLKITTYKYKNPRVSPKDMAQDIVCHLLAKGIDQVKEPEKFHGFVKRVAVNRILDSLKKHIPPSMSLDFQNDSRRPSWEPASPTPGPVALTMERNLLEIIEKGLFSLSQKCAESLKEYIAYKRDGKYADYAALAIKMNLKVSTLSSRVTRCLEQLSEIPEIKNWLEA